MDFSLLLQQNRMVCLLVVIALLAIISFVVLFSQQKPVLVNRVAGSIGILMISGSLLVAATSVYQGTLYTEIDGDPSIVLHNFYDAILSQNYSTAYDYLADETSLGLENEPESVENRLVWTALRNSYRVQYVGEVTRQEKSAYQTVTFTYLDISALLEDAQAGMEGILETNAENKPREEIADEDGNYLQSFLDEAYLQALKESLQKADNFYRSITYEVELVYADGSWRIRTNDEMLQGFQGQNKDLN